MSDGALTKSQHRRPRPLSRADKALLWLYPFTVFLANLAARPWDLHLPTTDNPGDAPNPGWTVIGFLTDKDNLLNRWFMQLGWSWVSAMIGLAFLCLYRPPSLYTSDRAPLLNTSAAQAERERSRRRKVHGLGVRYAAATGAWVTFTQWFLFGAPVMDRLFLLTGGRCTLPSHPGTSSSAAAAGSSTSAGCRLLGGLWEGGYDPSGHVFLAVLGSSLLYFELLRPSATLSSFPSSHAVVYTYPRWLRCLGWTVLAAFWFMLVVTNVWFHPFAECVGGLVAAYAEVLSVYVWFRGQLGDDDEKDSEMVMV